MQIILLIAATFLVCWLIDKGFTRVFRGQKEHKSGLSVRLNKKYGAFGVILAAMGIGCLIFSDTLALTVGGVIVLVLGIGLTVYYLTFGVFYDSEGFVLTTFGKRSQRYRFADIRTQQLYTSYGTVIIELQLSDNRTVQLQSGMLGVYPFLDAAFFAWCSQTGHQPEDCDFHDPANSCWFPNQVSDD